MVTAVKQSLAAPEKKSAGQLMFVIVTGVVKGLRSARLWRWLVVPIGWGLKLSVFADRNTVGEGFAPSPTVISQGLEDT
jgi:hypothetical protein